MDHDELFRLGRAKEDTDDDTPNEECGIFGVFAPGEDAARLTFFGLFALQHRGQESAGIAVSDGTDTRVHKDMGLVTQVFDEEGVVGPARTHRGRAHALFDHGIVGSAATRSRSNAAFTLGPSRSPTTAI
jgi:amidophosphoribosyltransferase